MLFPKLHDLAFQKGYALFCHGSFKRDMDLFLFPWQDQVPPVNEIINDIAEMLNAKIQIKQNKPHGREAVGLIFSIGNFVNTKYYIDLSYVNTKE